MITSTLSPTAPESRRDMTESQKALELRKFFTPQSSVDASSVESGLNEILVTDGALNAYAETVVWRLRGMRAMIGLVDRGTQYYLAGAIRTSNSENDEVVENDSMWFGCSTAPLHGSLCECTLAIDAIDGTADQYQCFTVNDLTQDERFARLPFVDGSVAAYRFYTGTSIVTTHGIKIGTLFLLDDKVRDGMSFEQRKFLHLQASNVMKHLETKREATERRRVASMSQGIANFLERTSAETETSGEVYPMAKNRDPPSCFHYKEGEGPTGAVAKNEPTDDTRNLPKLAKELVLDKIRVTLDHAAQILRESLELSAGGVVFLDTAVSYTDTNFHLGTGLGAHAQQMDRDDRKRHTSDSRPKPPSDDCHEFERNLSTGSGWRSTNKHKSSKVLAISSAKTATWDHQSNVLDGKTLQALIKSYPKGNVWYLDDEGYFSSLEQVDDHGQNGMLSPSGRRSSAPELDVAKQKAEAAMLSKVFQNAKQIIFLPLWDAGGDRWYSGCFLWSQCAVPVFTVESEISYLSAFTSSVMVEISRLDAITSNKMKSDFISSISHEFRSPLHGILASAEFLRDSKLDASQIEFISTIQNCGGTLLDTINHVLDYSKINSFEKSGRQKGTISNELYQVTNLALLCEDIVSGMIAAKEFRGPASGDASIPMSSDSTPRNDPRAYPRKPPLEIILDIEGCHWQYKIQAGALRRVVMNIFGNAQKYTVSGHILVQLRAHDTPCVGQDSGAKSESSIVTLRIRDSGIGMSSEYMERKLYHPFAQEDNFAPGVGLGLSIVWSIINQLGGKISIRSELGKGTDVEITLPIEKAGYGNSALASPGNLIKISAEALQLLVAIKNRAVGKSIFISRNETLVPKSEQKDRSWSCIEKYCTEWFGFQVQRSPGDLIITDDEGAADYCDGQRVLVVRNDVMPLTKQENKGSRYAISNICSPIGPFKLARSIMSLLDQEIRPQTPTMTASSSDAGTQTPLGSPEERTIFNGMILTDYGFKEPLAGGTSNTAEGYKQPNNAESIARIPVTEESSKQESIDEAIATIRASPGLTLRQPPKSKLVRSQAKPATVVAVPVPKDSSTNAVPPSPKGLNILAVDDNALNLQLLCRYLQKRKGDTIIQAMNGVEAVDAVKGDKGGGGFDIIFMDISMPLMDGFEATRLIRSFERSQDYRRTEEMRSAKITANDKNDANCGEGDKKGVNNDGKHDEQETMENETLNGNRKCEKRSKRASIVALTGLASRRDRDQADQSGFDDFLTKPISFGTIGALLERLSAEKEGR